MDRFEYKVVPAPDRGRKVKGARTAPDRFAAALEAMMNDLAVEGWEYHRAETLPSEERSGLTGKTIVYRNLLIFRRVLPTQETTAPAVLETPEPAPEPVAETPRRTEADRARSAAVPRSLRKPENTPEEAAAAAAAAALRSVRGRVRSDEEAPEDGAPKDGAPKERARLVSLMAEKRKGQPGP